MARRYIAIARGLRTGIFNGWGEASQYVIGFSGNNYIGDNNLDYLVKWLWNEIRDPALFDIAIESSPVEIPEEIIISVKQTPPEKLAPGDHAFDSVRINDIEVGGAPEFELARVDTKSEGKYTLSHEGMFEQDYTNDVGENRSQEIGRWGEEFAVARMKSEYADAYPVAAIRDTEDGFQIYVEKKILVHVIWRNIESESNSCPDVIIKDACEEIFVEVKTTRSPNFDRVMLTPDEWDLANTKCNQYIVLLVTNAMTREANIQRVRNPLDCSGHKPYPVPPLPKSRSVSPISLIDHKQHTNKSTQVYYEGIGRRKTSTARVRITMNGNGKLVVNGQEGRIYFPRLGDFEKVVQPLQLALDRTSSVDVSIIVKGGGVSGQVDATQLGLARALLCVFPELRPTLRAAGLLTRDSRAKERKKPGLKRARKAPTYTKR